MTVCVRACVCTKFFTGGGGGGGAINRYIKKNLGYLLLLTTHFSLLLLHLKERAYVTTGRTPLQIGIGIGTGIGMRSRDKGLGIGGAGGAEPNSTLAQEGKEQVRMGEEDEGVLGATWPHTHPPFPPPQNTPFQRMHASEKFGYKNYYRYLFIYLYVGS